MFKELYSFRPIDTLFFRGAEPMMMGESHSSNFHFPPPSHTIEGAIRTFLFHKDRNGFSNLIKAGERKGGFNVIGPMFLLDNNIFLPVPFAWYAKKKKPREDSNKPKKIIKLKRATQYNSFIKTPEKALYWAKAEENELESLGGKWCGIEDFFEVDNDKKKEIEIKNISNFFCKEPHTGIALSSNRTVRKSHIYSFTHSRLKEGVEILFGVDRELSSNDGNKLSIDGEILKLGAEQKFGKLTNQNQLLKKYSFNDDTSYFMTLSIIEGSEETNKSVTATGSIIYLGGWDLHKGFHKEMRGYFPAGTVFSEPVAGNLHNFIKIKI